MGYDAPLPFVPGSWVPASVSGYGAGPAGMTAWFAGMKDGWEGLGAVREPPLHDDPFASREGWWVDCLDRGLRRFSQMGYDALLPFVPRVLGCRLRGNDVGVRGNDGWVGRIRGGSRTAPT